MTTIADLRLTLARKNADRLRRASGWPPMTDEMWERSVKLWENASPEDKRDLYTGIDDAFGAADDAIAAFADEQTVAGRVEALETALAAAAGKLCPHCKAGAPLNRDGDMHLVLILGSRTPVACNATQERALLEGKTGG